MSLEPDLPFVDELPIEIAADRDTAWTALLTVLERSFDSTRGRRPARLLGCEDIEPSGPRPLAKGSAFRGFHVTASEPGRKLALAGRHRFSTYRLTFHLEEVGAGQTSLKAETRAVFPGLRGRVYRGLVIGTRTHVLMTRRLLTAIKRRAERS